MAVMNEDRLTKQYLISKYERNILIDLFSAIVSF